MFDEYLTKADREAIEDEFINNNIEYTRELRDRVLDGVNRRFRADILINKQDNGDQLFSDLRMLSAIERLSDGTVPLEQWLTNALRRVGAIANFRRLLEVDLHKVKTRQPTTAEVTLADVPVPVESEEVITDGVDDLLDVSFLALGQARVAAVAKILVPRFLNDQPVMLTAEERDSGAGTGWMITEDLLVSNFHVIRMRATGEQFREEDLRLQSLGANVCFSQNQEGQLGHAIGVSELMATGRTKQTDYAIMRLSAKPGCSYLPISHDPVKMPDPLPSKAGTAVKIFGVNIIQHPLGGPKRVAIRNNKVFAAPYPALHYFTDTLEGSSGSPVFDDDWRVIALHRGSLTARTEYNGKKSTGYINQGVQMHAILADLQQQAQNDPKAKTALAEILQAQSG